MSLLWFRVSRGPSFLTVFSVAPLCSRATCHRKPECHSLLTMRCHSSWPLANLRLSAQHISHSPRQPGSTPLWSMWWVCRSVTRLLHPIYYFLLKCHCIRPVRCRTGSEPRWPLLHLPSLDSIAHTHPSMHRKCALPHHCTDSTGPWRPETPNTSSSASSSPISRMFICLLTFLTIISSNQVLSDRNRFCKYNKKRWRWPTTWTSLCIQTMVVMEIPPTHTTLHWPINYLPLSLRAIERTKIVNFDLEISGANCWKRGTPGLTVPQMTLCGCLGNWKLISSNNDREK